MRNLLQEQKTITYRLIHRKKLHNTIGTQQTTDCDMQIKCKATTCTKRIKFRFKINSPIFKMHR